MRAAIRVFREWFGTAAIVGAEVGVWKGLHAVSILETMVNVRLLYLVDPYERYDEWTPDIRDEIENADREAHQKLLPFKERTKWVRKKFGECTRQDIAEPLDFVYIDGNHAYEYVRRDIAVAAQLVKKGEIIAGHDAGAEGVDKAVLEYCKERNIVRHVGGNEAAMRDGELKNQGWDWWFTNG